MKYDYTDYTMEANQIIDLQDDDWAKACDLHIYYPSHKWDGNENANLLPLVSTNG
jgi:hypothetical protein